MIINALQKTLKAKVNLPASKSISNRALMINAYSEIDFPIENLSDADDTIMLMRHLKTVRTCAGSSIPLVIDCGNAGTVFRFLLSYLASTPGKWLLTGTERMKSRPIDDLVQSLKLLGAEIYYVENQLFPPLRIVGKKLSGGSVAVSMEKSSQFASSLAMAAPHWDNGLELLLTGNLRSLPYFDMTLQMMEHSGASVMRSHRSVKINPQHYQPVPIVIEPDWSAASYWYEMVALSDGGELLLSGLRLHSLQGDKAMVEMFAQMGVRTFEEPDGILIFKSTVPHVKLSFDLCNTPDLLPALAATCCGLKKQAVFTGLENLKYKESDRTLALQEQLSKLHCRFEKQSEGTYSLDFDDVNPSFSNMHITFETYSDHRMAMALAPLALKLKALTIENPEVVVKSYPTFWNELLATAAIGTI